MFLVKIAQLHHWSISASTQTFHSNYCEKLHIKEGETTADGLFTVVGVECLGACGYAPMMQLGDFYQEHLNETKIDQLIADCKDNKITLLAK